MALFSHSSSPKKDERKPQAIPEEILSSVRIMGDENKAQPLGSPRSPEAPANLPAAPASLSASSPFLSVPPQVPPRTAPSSLPERKNEAPFSPDPVKIPKKVVPSSPASFPRKTVEKIPSFRKKWPLFLVIGLIVLLVLAGGGYYYWQNEKARQELSNEERPPQPEPSTLPESPSKVPVIKTLPYALDKPNYLSLDTETAEVSGIKKNIDEVAARLVEGSVAEPIEFIITDKNNNPLAFSRFVYLLGLSLPQELLGQIEEAFSLYLSAESGRTVAGLKLTLKDPARGSALITQGEGKLPQQLAPLLYSGANITIPTTTTFTPSPSRADVRIIRYHNFSLEPNISFDYTVSGEQWFIGTSKEMFRRMLEKAE